MQDINPEVRTGHDLLEVSARQNPRGRCLGHRPWDPVKKEFGFYVWEDYSTVAKRRAYVGMGIVEAHKKAAILDSKYGVGIYCQNRPEWQIVGTTIFSDQWTSGLTQH